MNKIVSTLFILLTILTASVWLATPAFVHAQGDDDYNLLTPLPLGEGGENVPVIEASEDGFAGFVNDMIVLAIALAAGLAVVMIVIGGIKYMTSESSDGKRSGKEYVTNAVGGLLLALGSFIILNTINPDLVAIRGIESVQIAFYDTPTETGWYYQKVDNSWVGPFGTDVDAQERCEEEGKEALGIDDNRNACTFIRGDAQDNFCWFEEEVDTFRFPRCSPAMSLCQESMCENLEDGESVANCEKRDDVVVECKEYQAPNEHVACLSYNPTGLSDTKEACYPSMEACNIAYDYINPRRSDVTECTIANTPSNQNIEHAEYCYDYTNTVEYRQIEGSECDTRWNDNRDACVEAARERDDEVSYSVENIDSDPCYDNPDYGGHFTNERDIDAFRYTGCIALDNGDYVCAPSINDCKSIAVFMDEDETKCYTKIYREGDYSSTRLVEPCTSCTGIDKAIVPIKSTSYEYVRPDFMADLHDFGHKLTNRLNVEPAITAGGKNWQVTEAWPPTTVHQSRCHRNGTCVDLNFSGPSGDTVENRNTPGTGLNIVDTGDVETAATIIKDTMIFAETSNLCLVYELPTNQSQRALDLRGALCGDTECVENEGDTEEEKKSKYAGRNIISIPVSAPHFSVYQKGPNGELHPNCRE